MMASYSICQIAMSNKKLHTFCDKYNYSDFEIHCTRKYNNVVCLLNNKKGLTIPVWTLSHLQMAHLEAFEVHHSLPFPLPVHLIDDEAAKSSFLLLHICNIKQKNHPSEDHGSI